MPSTKTSTKTTFENLVMLLKQIELAYNLAPQLDKSQIKNLKKEFSRLMQNYGKHKKSRL